MQGPWSTTVHPEQPQLLMPPVKQALKQRQLRLEHQKQWVWLQGQVCLPDRASSWEEVAEASSYQLQSGPSPR